MARGYSRTWQKGNEGRSGRWRKKYKGKTYYFAGGRGKTDREAYEAAVEEWTALKVRIDADEPRPHERDHQEAVEEWEQVLAWSSRHGDRSMAETADEKVRSLRGRLQAPVLKPLTRDDHFQSLFRTPTIDIPDPAAISPPDLAEVRKGLTRHHLLGNAPTDRLQEFAALIDGSSDRLSRAIWRDRLDSQRTNVADVESSLGPHCERYARYQMEEMSQGNRSASRVYASGLHLRHFSDCIGAGTDISKIDSESLMAYRSSVLERVISDQWSKATAREYLRTVKAFLRWLWRLELIPDLPRVLDRSSNFMSIAGRVGDVEVFEIQQTHALLKGAAPRTRLFILLMLNCGMTQKDLSDLCPSEVDWERGRIERKRSKTKKFDNVPIVDYRLWPETFQLLRTERVEGSSERVFLNENGSPLCTASVDGDGRYRKTDNVKNAFDRLRAKVGITLSLKSLKKTSATLLRGNERFQALPDFFLGHAPKKTSDRHYTKPPAKLMDAAIDWLRAELQIEKALAGTTASDGSAASENDASRREATAQRETAGKRTGGSHSRANRPRRPRSCARGTGGGRSESRKRGRQ